MHLPDRRRAATLGICLLLAVAHTWPLALHPARYSRNDNADTALNEWIMAWVAHQLPRDPLHLFEANIFYPAHDALAFSEPLIVPALIGAPLAWAGASPVLVYNLVLILGFALTAWATCLLVESWTGRVAAGLIAGSAFAFNTHTLTRLAHIQGIHLYGLPLALLALDRLLDRERRHGAVALAACLALMAYTSGYLVVFATIMIAVVLAVRAPEWIAQWRIVLPRVVAAGILAGLIVAPLMIPYRRVAVEQHMVRTLASVAEFSATPRGYLASASRVHGSTWSARFFSDDVNSFFPGFTVLGLCLVAGVAGTLGASHLQKRGRISGSIAKAPGAGAALNDANSSDPDPEVAGTLGASHLRVGMLVVLAGAGFVLSLGTATPLYGWLFHVFPPMQGLRVAARFGNLFLLATALLAGLGAAAWNPRRGVWLVLLLLVNLEALRAPFTYTPFDGVPGIYRLLADEAGPVVLAEQPFFPRTMAFENAPYVLASTAHWRPLMNGYSGYTPSTYQHYADAFWYFPQEHAIAAMKAAGVTHVVVHVARFHHDNMAVEEVIDKRADFELMAVGRDGMRLYRLKR